MLPLTRWFRCYLAYPAREHAKTFDLDLLRRADKAPAAVAHRADLLICRYARGGARRVDALSELLRSMVDERTWRRVWRWRWNLDGFETPGPAVSARLRRAALREYGEHLDFFRPKDRRAARLAWQRAAEAGDAEAANMLGETLRDGLRDRLSWTRPKHRREAAHWFRVGAEGGDPTARLNYGYSLFYGEGVRRDREAALRWYWLAAGSRDRSCASKAMHNIGHMYRRGEGVPRSWDAALRWYHKAAHRGSVMAEHWLGRIYGGDEAPPERPQLAIPWLEKAAAHGDMQSQTSLAIYLHNGTHMPQDRPRAAALYRKAADQGDDRAMYLLGLCYRDGEGVRRSVATARRWFRRAAKAGDSDAPRELVALSRRPTRRGDRGA